jgi:hypothetical protein
VDVDVRDIGLVVGEDLRELVQQARPIRGDDEHGA